MSNRFQNRVNGFLHVEGRNIVNGAGDIVILRGYCAGNWTNPEGFMVGGTTPFDGAYNQPKKLDRHRSMDLLIRELCGTEYAKKFWPQWYRNYMSEQDIALMAEVGYNSVRLVLNASAFLYEEPGYQWNEDSFAMLDNVLEWCEKYKIYAILDMHAVPGGQSCGGCDNAVDNQPHLFFDEESKERAIRVWEEFANRYKDRWIVGGYDLLNEPLNNPGSLVYTDQLISFYDELIARIRKIDKNHLLIVEGTIWSTQASIFTHNYDPYCDNWCIQVHIYGFVPEMAELYGMLERSIELNVPIWMGEGGAGPEENSIFLDTIAQENVGFCLWVWKSAARNGAPEDGMNTEQYDLPKDWEMVRKYADEGGPRPSYEHAQKIFDEYLENLKFEHCRHGSLLHKYNLRQPGISLPAVGYDHGRNGQSFLGNWYYGNAYNYRIEDRTKLVVKPGGYRPGPKSVWGFSGQTGFGKTPNAIKNLWLEMSDGEYVHYSVYDVKDHCDVRLSLRALCPSCVRVSWGELENVLNVEPSQDTVMVSALSLPAGDEFSCKVEVLSGTVQFDRVFFD